MIRYPVRNRIHSEGGRGTVKQDPKVSEREIDEFREQFGKRYILKKRVNALLCFFIFLCGTTALLYSRFVFHNPLFDRLRYMTFWGTIFTSAVSFIFGIVCIMEAARETEVTYRPVYFLRLSSATTEAVIFAVVMVGLTPIVPDVPDLSSYPGIMMHLVIPVTTVMSFLLNDPPIGRPKPEDPLKGVLIIAVYAAVMTLLFGTGTLSSEKAPYSFLDFENTSMLFKLGCLAAIFAVGYAVAWLLMRLNMKLSWVWFYDKNRSKKKG